MNHWVTVLFVPPPRYRRGGSLLAVGALALAFVLGCDVATAEQPAPVPAPQVTHAERSPSPPAEPVVQQLAPSQSEGADESRGYVAVVVARESIDVAARFRGEVKAVHVRIGDRVKAGDSLATLDPTRARQELAVAKARLRGARAELSGAGAEARQARNRSKRREEFAEVVPKEEIESARFSSKKARAARSRASADVAHEKALIAQIEHQLSETELRAPFAGKVSARYLDPGSSVAAGESVVRLINADELWLKFAVPGRDIAGLSPGDSISVELDGVADTLSGTVRQIAPELESSTKMFFVEAELSIPAERKAAIHAGQVGRVKPAGQRAVK